MVNILTNPAWWAVLVALLSAGIAVAAILVARATARRQIALQARVTEIEEARRTEELQAQQQANLIANMIRRPPRYTKKGPKSGAPAIRVHNDGQATANKFSLEVVSTDGKELPPIDGLELLPIDLHADQPREFVVHSMFGTSGAFKVTVRWVDTEPREKVFDLTLPAG